MLEAPTLVLGGGPAGVVELAKMEVVGLLVGVVEVGFWARLLKREAPPWLWPPPKSGFGVSLWVADGSGGLLGVMNDDGADDCIVLLGCDGCDVLGADPKRPVLEELDTGVCAKVNPPDVLFPPPKMLLLPPPGAVPLPNKPPLPEDVAAVPKRPLLPEDADVLPKSPLDGACVVEADLPVREDAELPAGCPKEKVGFCESDMVDEKLRRCKGFGEVPLQQPLKISFRDCPTGDQQRSVAPSSNLCRDQAKANQDKACVRLV